jgi:hypothetical protein
MEKIDIGDVFEIQTRRGFGYFQFCYSDDELGEMIRVLEGVDETRPSDIAALVNTEEQFYTFFPIAAALKKSIVSRVAHLGIPVRDPWPPLMRSPGRYNAKTRRVETWWISQAGKAWQVDALDENEKDLSVKGILNDTLLIEHIESGWRPRDFV